MQPTANDSQILDNKAKDEVPLLQQTADNQPSLPLHQDDEETRQGELEIELHSPQLMEEEEADVYTLQELVCSLS